MKQDLKEIVRRNIRIRIKSIKELNKRLEELEAGEKTVRQKIALEQGRLDSLARDSQKCEEPETEPKQAQASTEARAGTPARFRRLKSRAQFFILQAISHYEASSAKSKITMKAIEIFIRERAPSLLGQFKRATLKGYITRLRKWGYVASCAHEYRLTAMGREVLKNMGGEVHHG